MNTRNIIMRRVYYSFALSFVERAAFWQGMFLGVATLLLGRWLHVASIYKNILAQPALDVPAYVMNSYAGAWAAGEVLMVLTFTAATAVALYVVYDFLRRVPMLRMV